MEKKDFLKKPKALIFIKSKLTDDEFREFLKELPESGQEEMNKVYQFHPEVLLFMERKTVVLSAYLIEIAVSGADLENDKNLLLEVYSKGIEFAEELMEIGGEDFIADSQKVAAKYGQDFVLSAKVNRKIYEELKKLSKEELCNIL